MYLNSILINKQIKLEHNFKLIIKIIRQSMFRRLDEKPDATDYGGKGARCIQILWASNRGLNGSKLVNW